MERSAVKKFRSEHWMALILGLFAILFVGFLSLHRALWFDEAIYIGMGKWFFSHGKIGIFDSLRPLLFPIWVGSLWKLGINPRVGAIFSNFIFAILSSIILFKLSKPLGKFRALPVVFFLLNILVLKFYSFALTEPLAIFFVCLSIYYFMKRRYSLFGVFSGLTFLTRFPFAIVFLTGIVQILIDKKMRIKSKLSKILSSAISFFLVILPYFIFNYFKYNGHMFYPLLSAVRTVSSAPPNNDLLFYPKVLLSSNIMFAFAIIPIILLCFKSFRNRISRKEVSLLLFNALAFLITLAYFTHVIHKESRYALAMLPYASLLAAYGLVFIYKRFFEHKSWRIKQAALILIISIVVVSGVRTPIRFLNRYATHPERTDYFYNQNLSHARRFVVQNLKNYSLTDSSIILTNDVSFTYYTDNKIVSLVFPDYTMKILDMNLNKSGFIIINTCNLKCYDAKCELEKSKILSFIDKFPMLFRSPRFGDCRYVVYKNQPIHSLRG